MIGVKSILISNFPPLKSVSAQYHRKDTCFLTKYDKISLVILYKKQYCFFCPGTVLIVRQSFYRQCAVFLEIVLYVTYNFFSKRLHKQNNIMNIYTKNHINNCYTIDIFIEKSYNKATNKISIQ